MKTTPATNHGGNRLNLAPVRAERRYKTPRLTKLSPGQAEAILAERKLAGDAEFERMFQSPLKNDPVG